jgi:Flp pilus assembly protein TadG
MRTAMKTPVENSKSPVAPKAGRGPLKRFRDARDGQFSIMLAVALPMIMVAVGSVADVSQQQRLQGELQNALDAGTLAGAAIAFEGATTTQIQDRIRAYFMPMCPVPNCATAVTLNITFANDRLTTTATGNVRTHFMGMFGKSQLPVAAKAESTLKSVPVFYEVHMVLDNSGSMNIVDGVNNIRFFRDKFLPWNSICAFACHSRSDPNATYQGKTGFETARQWGVPLREDRIKNEMIDQAQRLLTGANATRAKVAVYDFDWWVYQRRTPSNVFGQVKKSIEDVQNQSGGTQYAYFANELQRLVGPSGTGASATSPRKAIILITDGVQQNLYTGKVELISQSACNVYKAEGRDLYVLNIAYPDPLEIGNQWYSQRAEMIALQPQLEGALQTCASPGRYFRADYGVSIDTALESITNAIMRDARQMYLAM